MDNIKDDHYYVRKIKEDLTFIVKHMEKIDIEELSKHELLQDSMMFRLIQISENAKRLSDDYRDQHGIIPWTAIYGLRNRIVHDYGSVELTIVFDTLKNDIPGLLNLMEKEL
ncbi:MAG: DUF86 domain-containing protein [Blautia sp.]|nr:DUF86 domain-containing protein [Blautia sp.]